MNVKVRIEVIGESLTTVAVGAARVVDAFDDQVAVVDTVGPRRGDIVDENAGFHAIVIAEYDDVDELIETLTDFGVDD